jgi:catecholate siderophore receptor
MLALIALPLVAAAALAAPPEPRFTLQGRVLDPTGAGVASGEVTAAALEQAATLKARTGATGEYTLVLPRGTYSVRATAPGFVDAVASVTARDDGRESRDFALRLAPIGETVTVRAPRQYDVDAISSATKTLTPLRDVPQAVSVTSKELIRDQLMLSMGDVMRYTPGISVHQGENNRDQVIIRGNSSSADFFLNGVRDDVQYYRDLYNLERVEALKGPNAMMFGRGGGGGVVNRVTKEAVFQPIREAVVQAGGYGHVRSALDLDQPLNDKVALRLNGLYENSDSFRDFVGLERYAFNPTATIAAGDRTRLVVGYEHLRDTRVADRGITSYQGRPADVDISTYYGNPDDSHVRATVDLGSASVEHQVGRLLLRNRTLYGHYDRSYQNYVPGAADATATTVALTAYNNATGRDNVFNQTDAVYSLATGPVKHTLLAGVELGWQATDNFRNTGFFDDATTAIQVPFDAPTTTTPVTFRQSPTDAFNHLDTKVAASYLQDQADFGAHFQVVGGLRFDRFDITYQNKRNGDTLARVDDLVSPRLGLVYKPITPVSVYSSYAVSYLPSSGDQFSSLTTITEQLEPEKFTNYELGAKWEPHPSLIVTTAVYQLDRTNTRSIDPNDPTRIVQTGRQRTKGFELGVTGRLTSKWLVAGGYSYQDAFVTSATAAAREGAHVAQVPRNTVSLWNNYQLLPKLGGAIGVLYRTDMFAGIDNTVTLPGYTRVDAAAFYSLRKDLRLQANLENVFDKKYWTNADSNTNISPGFPRTLRVALTAAF